MTALLLPALATGFVVGFRHAFEPDHLAAVTTLAMRDGGRSHAARLGVAWGIGHTASVAAVAVVLIVLGVRIPERFYATAELGVATLLISLGVGSLMVEARRHRQALGAPPAHAHHRAHAHPADIRTASRALGFGLAHGLAGSGAVVVLLVAASRDVGEQFAYLLTFGLGTIVGMSLVSVLAGTATGVMTRRHARAARYVRLGAATCSGLIGGLLGASVLAALRLPP